MLESRIGKARTRAALAATAVLLLAAAARAADVEFYPSLRTSYFVDGNPNVVGEDAESDTVTRLDVELAARSRSRATTWDLSYRPYREFFSDQSLLDNTGHHLSYDLRHDISRRSNFGLRVLGSITERQQVRYEDPDVPDSVVPRTTIDRLSILADGRVDVGARSFVTWRALGGIARYEDLPTEDFDDSNQVGVEGGWGRRISERSRLGMAYTLREIDFENDPSTRTHTLDVTSSFEFGPKLKLEGRAGIIRIETAGESDNAPSIDLRLTRRVDRGNNLYFGIRNVVTPGTGSGHPSEDTGGFVTWRYSGSRTFGAEVTASYWHRVDATPGSARSGTSGVQSAERVSWNLGEYVSLGLFHTYTDQEGIGSTGSSSDTSYNSGGVFLSWDILGRTRR